MRLNLSAIALTTLALFSACGGGGGGSRPAPATLVSIAVTPTNPAIALGTTRQFTATGTYSDATTGDLTALVDWSSSGTEATISNDPGTEGLATSVGVGGTTISATYSGVSGSTSLTVSSAALVTIEVTPTNPAAALGTEQQFAATGTFSDGTTQDLTDQVTWDSSTAGSATISNVAGTNGLAATVGVGDTTITATLSAISGSTTFTVSSAVLVAIGVTPTNPAIALGTEQQFAATGVFSDATTQDLTDQVTWGTSAAAATVSNDAGTNGLADSVAVGSTSISATLSGVSGSTTLTVTNASLVSIAVTPTNPSIALGTTQPFVAMGTFTDGSVQDLSEEVAWASSDEAFAAVSNADGSSGLATAIGVGDATISATLGAISGSTTLTVGNATLVSIDVTPAAPAIALGTTQSFSATGIYTDASKQNLTSLVTWASSDPAIASVSNADGSRGLATSVAVGSTTVSASLSGTSGSTSLVVSAAALVSIEVTPAAAEIAKGTSQAFSALGLLSDGTREDLTDQVTWSSADESVAVVSNAAGSRGLATGLDVGLVTITATFSGIAGGTALDVSAETLVSIDVEPFLQTIANGTTLQFSATGTYTDGSTQDLTTLAAWSSSAGGVATISNAAGSRGLATGLAVGSTTITAQMGLIAGSVDLDVSSAVLVSITVEPADPSVPLGMTHAFTATGVFSDASTQDLTALAIWTSSDTAVAAISNAAASEGLATGLAGGTATITAAYAGEAGSTTLSVTSAALVSITIDPDPATVPSGYSSWFTATGDYSDGSTLDLTTQVVWASSATNFATISNSAGTEGRATGVANGTSTISATLGGISGSTTLTVTNESLVSIEVTPDPVTLSVGETQQMTATGTFSGGSVLDVTANVRWSSNDRGTATVGNNAATKGLVTARSDGTATIRAKKGNRNGTASVTVL